MVSSESVSPPVRVFLVDDHPDLREALRNRIESTLDVNVCGAAGSAQEAFRHIERLRPNVAVVGIPLEDSHGLDLVRTVRARCPDTQLVVFSMYSENVYAERALRAGAHGYVVKGESVTTLIDAIRAAERGEVFLSSRLSARILARMVRSGTATDRPPIDELVEREKTAGSRKTRAA